MEFPGYLRAGQRFPEEDFRCSMEDSSSEHACGLSTINRMNSKMVNPCPVLLFAASTGLLCLGCSNSGDEDYTMGLPRMD